MIDDYEPDELDDEGTPAAELAPVEERETRGLLWLLLPIPVGAVLGATIGHVRDLGHEPGVHLVSGLEIGTVIGVVLGVVLWVFFPYKKKVIARDEG